MEVAGFAYGEVVSYIQDIQSLGIVGLVAVIVCSALVYKAVIWTPFKLYFLAQVLPGVNLEKFGKWAVITGATDGIGKEYAKAMAKRGLDIVLLSRSDEKLTKVAKEIESEYHVKTRTIAVDFAETDIYEELESKLLDLDIAILINNVGRGSGLATFLKTENLMHSTLDMVHINCVAMSQLCAIVLPRMLEKRKGVVLNVSSIGSAGFVAATTYSATKAYVSRFSDCLQRTYKKSGVIIQTVEPGMVLTNMLNTSLKLGSNSKDTPKTLAWGRDFSAVSPEAFVRCSVNTIGWTDYTNGHILHYMTSLLVKVQPQSYTDNSLLSDMEC